MIYLQFGLSWDTASGSTFSCSVPIPFASRLRSAQISGWFVESAQAHDSDVSLELNRTGQRLLRTLDSQGAESFGGLLIRTTQFLVNAASNNTFLSEEAHNFEKTWELDAQVDQGSLIWLVIYHGTGLPGAQGFASVVLGLDPMS